MVSKLTGSPRSHLTQAWHIISTPQQITNNMYEVVFPVLLSRYCYSTPAIEHSFADLFIIIIIK